MFFPIIANCDLVKNNRKHKNKIILDERLRPAADEAALDGRKLRKVDGAARTLGKRRAEDCDVTPPGRPGGRLAVISAVLILLGGFL